MICQLACIVRFYKISPESNSEGFLALYVKRDSQLE